MKMGGNNRHGLSEINVTPLVDVMLVLLIVFMVGAPMLKMSGVPLTLPKADSEPVEVDQEQLVISITEDAEIFLGDMQTELASLTDQLRNLRERQPDRLVYLRADEQVAYGVVVRVLAAAERAGIHDLGMMTEPERL